LALLGLFCAAAGVFGPDVAKALDPAEPRVTLELGWVAAAELTDPEDAGPRERLVTGPRPEGADQRLVTARFRYEGDRPVDGLRIELAIPETMRYIAGSATGPGADVSFSVDGGENFGAPATLSVPMNAEDPDTPMRPATVEDYSHIRWELPGTHAPGRTGLVSYRARLVEVAP